MPNCSAFSWSARPSTDSGRLRDKIDGYLKILNDDYRVERIEAIREVFVEILPTKVFADWMKMKGKEGGANKFPRVLKKELLSEWLQYIEEYKKEQAI